MATEESKPGTKVIYVAYFTTKSGKRIYAASKGLKAFRLVVKDKADRK